MERCTDLYCIDWDWADSCTEGKMDCSLTVHQQENFIFFPFFFSHSVFRLHSYIPPSLYALFSPSSLFIFSHRCLFFLFHVHRIIATAIHTHALAFSITEWLHCHYCITGAISTKQFTKLQLWKQELSIGTKWSGHNNHPDAFIINLSDNDFKWIYHSLSLSINDKPKVLCI